MYWLQLKRLKHYAAFGVIAICAASPASAQTTNQTTNATSDSQTLDTVVVEGKKERLDRKATVLTDSISGDTIAKKQVDDINDISRLDPAISYSRGSDSFTIRGLDQNRVLTTIDGVPITWFPDPSSRNLTGGISSFNISSLSSLDIVRGSDSSLYGSGALGGVVMLRTLDPEDLLTGDKNWASLTKGSYDSSNRSWHIDEAFAVRANDTYFLLQGGYVGGKQRENNGSVSGYGVDRSIANPADFDNNNLLFKVYQHVGKEHRFGFTAERFYFDGTTHGLNQAVRTYTPGTFYEDQTKKRERFSASYDYMGNGDGWLDEAHANIYWQRQRLETSQYGNRIPVPTGFYLRDAQTEERVYGFNVNGFKTLQLGATTHTVRVAIDTSFSKYQQYAGGEDSCPPPPYTRPFMTCQFMHVNQADSPTTESKNFGFAFEDEIAFYDGRVRITPGGRFDWYERDPKHSARYEQNSGFTGYPDSQSDSRFSPKLRGEWDVANKVTLYAQWAQAFRAPTASELYFNYTNPGFYYTRGNPDLKPETSNGFDIGVQLGDKDLGGSISVFSNRYKNFIDQVSLAGNREFPLGRFENINRARVTISGVEAKGHWQIGNGWHTNFALAYAEGRDTDKDEYLNSVPPLKGMVGLGYAQEIWGADVNLTAAGKRNKVAKNSDYARAPGYAVVDLTGWWEPMGEKGPRLQAGVYNLFDKTYWNALNLRSSTSYPKEFFSEPGRSFKLSFIQKF